MLVRLGYIPLETKVGALGRLVHSRCNPIQFTATISCLFKLQDPLELITSHPNQTRSRGFVFRPPCVTRPPLVVIIIQLSKYSLVTYYLYIYIYIYIYVYDIIYIYILGYLIQKTHFLGRPFIGTTRTPEVAIRQLDSLQPNCSSADQESCYFEKLKKLFEKQMFYFPRRRYY